MAENGAVGADKSPYREALQRHHDEICLRAARSRLTGWDLVAALEAMKGEIYGRVNPLQIRGVRISLDDRF